MINQIRADFYRQIHTIGMYIMFGLTIIYSAMTTLAQNVGGVTVHGDSDQFAQVAAKSWSVLTGIKVANMGDTMLLYVFIGVFVIIFGYEFSQKVYKNTLISGISRLQFVLAKYLVMLLDLLLLFAVNFLTALVAGLVAGRPLGGSWGTLFATFSLSFVAATFFVSVIFSIGVFLLVLTGSILIPAIVVVFPLIIGVLHVLGEWDWIKYIDFFGVAQNIGVGGMKVSALPPYIAVSLALLVVMIGSSALMLRNKEL
ncbi:ABC transporter permease [Lacticaseibacillus paracasei]|uniref:ABC transporter permease n=1 Tax=Lacticaseibacillus paracasei TaxID=1597 RepID=UPI0008DE1A61|nr:ABC transporter permease [Lacticaseibacillus paracasei]OHY51931.1 ABC transporter [Lacticaseibacillus paracasei]